MSYNNGPSSLFNQTGFTISSAIYAESIIPKLQPSASAQYTNIYGSSIQPKVVTAGASSIKNAYGLSLSLSISASNMSILSAYGLSVTAPTIASGTCSFLYGLYVAQPSTSGTGVIVNPYTAFIQGMVGIGTSIPVNALDVGSSSFNTGVVVGTYAGAITAPSNSVLVSGAVGIGTPNPVYPLDVQGGAEAFEVLAPFTTVNKQMSVLAGGYNQGGFGSGCVGTQLALSTLSAQIFSLASVNSLSIGLSKAVFDGRYVYFSPDIFPGVTRYDTTLPFSSSSSYLMYNASNLSGQPTFNGRYIYYSSQTLVRYDTSLPFTATTSYATFFTQTLNSLSSDYLSGCYDGKYMYWPPGFKNSTLTGPSGLLLRYNTELPFSLSSSYQVFDVTSISSLCAGYFGTVFDGRYVYYAPYAYLNSVPGLSGVVLRYDTTVSFTSASSYQFFNLAQINANAKALANVLFDGNFIYWIGNTFTVWVRYDPNFSFTNSLSYSFFDLSLANLNTQYYAGGFDGRFIYLAPFNTTAGPASGLIASYDTTSPFGNSASYQAIDASQINSLCTAYTGLCCDGQYIYFVPHGPGTSYQGVALRLPCYVGPPANTPAIGYSTGLTVSGSLKLLMQTATTATAGTAGASPSMSAGFLQVYINGNIQYIPFY